MNPRVIIADDEAGIRQMLAYILKLENVDVVAEARDGREALDMCLKYRPNALVADLRLPVLDAASVVTRLREAKTSIGTMIYTGTEDERQIHAALAARPTAFIHKCDGLEDLRMGVRCAIAGKVYYSARPAKIRSDPTAASPADTLTFAEIELWKMFATGHGTKEAADVLGKSEKTVGNQRAELMKKLRVHNLADLVRLAVKEGMVEC